MGRRVRHTSSWMTVWELRAIRHTDRQSDAPKQTTRQRQEGEVLCLKSFGKHVLWKWIDVKIRLQSRERRHLVLITLLADSRMSPLLFLSLQSFSFCRVPRHRPLAFSRSFWSLCSTSSSSGADEVRGGAASAATMSPSPPLPAWTHWSSLCFAALTDKKINQSFFTGQIWKPRHDTVTFESISDSFWCPSL